MLKGHSFIEKNGVFMLILTLVVVSIGGLVEIVPLFRMETTIEPVKGVRPLTPLELAGQNIYIREGCNVCHSQQIRPLRDEVERYGHYSLAAESMYDHPFVWGSKRTGPDLARVGGKYSDEWHTAHLINPRQVVPESIMPTYRFLYTTELNLNSIKKDLSALKMLGVPYSAEAVTEAYNDAVSQADPNGDPSGLQARHGETILVRDFDGQPDKLTEMDALVAYLQQLGTHVDFTDYNPDLAKKDKTK